MPRVKGWVKSIHARGSKVAGDRAVTSVSGGTAVWPHSAIHLNQQRHQQQSDEAALPWAPAQLAHTHFPMDPSSLGICSRRVEFKFRSQQVGQAVRGLPPSKVRGRVLKRPRKSRGKGPGGGSHSILRVGMRPAASPAYSWLCGQRLNAWDLFSHLQEN